MSDHIVYHRPDGVVGVGFPMEYAGLQIHSIAWPDRPAERFTTDAMERYKIRIEGEQVNEPHEDKNVIVETSEDSNPITEAEAIRRYLRDNPEASNQQVIAGLSEQDIAVTSSQVTRARKSLASDAE